MHALAAAPGVLYAAGAFDSIGGGIHPRVAAFDVPSGAPRVWNPDNDRVVYALGLDRGLLYAGGAYTQLGGQPRTGLAALDAGTGAATSWDRALPGEVLALLATAGAVYAGGQQTYDTSVYPRVMGYLAMLEAASQPVGVPEPSHEPATSLRLSVASPSRAGLRMSFELPSTARVWLDVVDAAGRRAAAPLQGEERRRQAPLAGAPVRSPVAIREILILGLDPIATSSS